MSRLGSAAAWQVKRKMAKCRPLAIPAIRRRKRGKSMTELLKLHIGSGRTKLAGFVNIDQIPGCDLQLDLNTDLLPFGDNSADCVFSYHAFEHFGLPCSPLAKFWRRSCAMAADFWS